MGNQPDIERLVSYVPSGVKAKLSAQAENNQKQTLNGYLQPFFGAIARQELRQQAILTEPLPVCKPDDDKVRLRFYVSKESEEKLMEKVDQSPHQTLSAYMAPYIQAIVQGTLQLVVVDDRNKNEQ